MPIHDWMRVYSGLFHHFHQSWTVSICNALNSSLLPDGITALVEQRSGSVEADVLTLDRGENVRSQNPMQGRGLATKDPPETQFISRSTKEAYAERANRIVIQQRLGPTIAVIEIVSPGNKDSKRAFKEFVEKSQDFIAKGIHLLVVDLFPPTKRDPHGIHRAIWDDFQDDDAAFEFPANKDRILASYKAGRSEKVAYVQPVTIGDTIPDMPLFLAEAFHVMVPLEATYQATWTLLPGSVREIVETGKMPVQDDE